MSSRNSKGFVLSFSALYIYLEPNYLFFCGVDLPFYRSNLPKYGSFGLWVYIYIELGSTPHPVTVTNEGLKVGIP